MEAKHSYFKQIAQIGNFKNIPYSVAVRHQRLLCAHLQGRFFDYEDLQSGPCIYLFTYTSNVAHIFYFPGGLPNKFQDEPNYIKDAVITCFPSMSSESVVVRY